MKSGLLGAVCASLFSLFGVVFPPIASAILISESSASLNLTLMEVSDDTGTTVTEDWEVFAEGTLLQEDANATGDGTASTNYTLAPAISMGIGDSIFQSSNSSTTAITGSSVAASITDLTIDIFNTSNQALTFEFSVEATAQASVSDPLTGQESGISFAQVLVQDTDIDRDEWANLFAFVNLETGPLFDMQTESGSVMFTLASGQFKDVSGGVSTFSNIDTGVIPLPPAVWLFGSGLLGMIGVARRKKAA